MAYELKKISREGLPAALRKAERYRDANEPMAAESICLDVLEIEPEHREALVLLLLSRTDQFASGLPSAVERAREVLPRLTTEYDRAYYGGIICERQAKYLLSQRGKRSGFVAWEWFQYAMEQYEIAEKLREPGNDDTILRWNTCARIIDRTPHCAPDPEQRSEQMLE